MPPSDAQVPLADQVRVGMDALPGTELRAVRPGATPTDTTQVIGGDPDLPESYYRTAFVDPHTGDLRGVLETYGSGQAMPLRAWVDQLHRNLLLGEPGRLYSELAASWLWVVALGGLALWIAQWRARRAAGRAAVRDLIRPEPSATGRRRTLSRHGSLGVWLLLGALFLSATGLTWSTYAGENVSALRASLGWSTPSLQKGGHAGHGGDPGRDRGVDPALFDTVLATAGPPASTPGRSRSGGPPSTARPGRSPSTSGAGPPRSMPSRSTPPPAPWSTRCASRTTR